MSDLGIETRLEKALRIWREAGELGSYDTSLVGMVGEIYAEKVLGMVKAPRSQAGYDGTINGRRVSVKTKERDSRGDRMCFTTLTHKHIEKVDDCVLVIMTEDGPIHYRFPVHEAPYQNHKAGRRYHFRKVAAWLEENDCK